MRADQAAGVIGPRGGAVFSVSARSCLIERKPVVALGERGREPTARRRGRTRSVNRLSELTLPTRTGSKAYHADRRSDPSPKHT